ncbi:PKD domain-containing protein [Paracidobacterium acidisoli]|uniref:PKD domain-containing protein n=1 Tax=Paracidobacterium acidisoli TaxID=2303751 RepID=A0A372ILQ4_9BACT|nr:PKD domain-containing protein [Paracidobacterium acidisoli]MBT9332410.1 alpha-galactosidase [Paracidobacterium acidisoli]
MHGLRTSLTSFILSAAALTLPLNGQTGHLQIKANQADGRYSISAEEIAHPILEAGAAAEVNGAWLKASDYPKHTLAKSTSTGELGPAEEWTLTYTGKSDAPDLQIRLRSYQNQPFGDVQVSVVNTTGKQIVVQAIRAIDAGADSLNLGGSHAEERVLSDSFSEDRPAMKIHDFSDPVHGMHRGVGSQIVYNLENHRSWFVGTLTSDKFLTVLRMHVSPDNPQKLASYEVEDTGTTELLNENSLRRSPPEDHVMLSLPVEPGATLDSERLLFGLGNDPVKQLETYGHLIRDLHHARVSAPVALGWWSWTAYYFGLNEGAALTNAEWLADNLKSYGYTFFHIDEGYQYARGEYTTPDADLFPHGLASVERKITNLGLTPGIWTAPFEVSERSWVYTHHPDWLVKNAQGNPIHIGSVSQQKDLIFELDTTNPGAQEYLHQTYRTLTRDWNLRYIKMDFMEDSAVEGYYYRPHTTALEAQRIGLQTIRDAVGDSVLLDKDGSEMLNPVGILDMGRISQDTGHSFSSSKDAATGIAARFYMNRNYFVADPDAFTVSTQVIEDHAWHGGTKPLSSDEAMVSMTLSAVSGGLFEIGDDLPTLGKSPDRLAWLKNRDLLDMVELGRASKPVDLMTYAKEDLQPSIFLLKESNRQSMLAVFNWTEGSRTHDLSLSQTGLNGNAAYDVTEILASSPTTTKAQGTLHIEQPPHSVRLLKLVDTSAPEQKPVAEIVATSSGTAGVGIDFNAPEASEDNPVLHYRWNFGDGTSAEGQHLTHTYTRAGEYQVTLTAVGLGEVSAEAHAAISITGSMPTRFHPDTQRRLAPEAQ